MTVQLPARDNEVLLLILGQRAGGTITVTEEELKWANTQRLGAYTYTDPNPADRSVTVKLFPRHSGQ